MELDYLSLLLDAIRRYKEVPSPPEIWVNGFVKWKKTSLPEIYFSDRGHNTTYYCCGDRMFYVDLVNGLPYIRGSYSNDWHGYSQIEGYDFKKALDWLKEAKYKELNFLLWSGLK